MKRNAIIVSGIFILSTIVQLGSQILVTRVFGASVTLDSFLAAVALPTILVTVIYGTLNDLYLPHYVADKNISVELANKKLVYVIFAMSTIGFFVSGVLAILGKWLMPILYGSSPTIDISSVISQFAFLSCAIPFSIIATLLGVYFYGQKAYSRFPFAQLIGSVVNLFLIFVLYKPLGIWALPFAFVVNIAFQIPFVLPKIKFSWTKVPIFPLLLIWLPLIIANLAMRFDTVIIRSFGAGLGTGYLVYLNLVAKVFSLSTNLLTIGIQVVLLPTILDTLLKKDMLSSNRLIVRAKLYAFVISVLMTVTVYFSSPIILKALFLGGKFSVVDLQRTVDILPWFVLPSIGWGIIGVFYQPLIATKKFKELAVIGTLSLIFAWIPASIFSFSGYYLLAISAGLTLLLFSNILMCELVWQEERKKNLNSV